VAWTIEYLRATQKSLKKFSKQDRDRIRAFLDVRLAALDDPRQLGAALQGDKLRQYWRYRVGDFRIICDIQDNRLVILVIEIGHRREIYR
jgi:mRNA interferase RelE/StbE